MKKSILLTAAFGLLASSAQAGQITGWDQANVITDPGPYVDFTTYNSIIYKPDGSTNGRVVWKHGDVQPVGLKVVNGDDMTGQNCLMTTGYNPFDLSDKQCSDPLQSSKRAKVKNTVSAPLEVDFLVDDTMGTHTYRMLQKLTNATEADLWDEFTIELGTRDADGNFVASTPGDGLGFSDANGNMTAFRDSDTSKDLVFSANFAQGLAGPADKYHPEPGYFNPSERMTFRMTSDEDTITSAGVSATYSDVFGPWVNSAGTPIAIFFDDDGHINTDNHLMGNCADSNNLVHVGSHSGDDVAGFSCNGTWVTFRGNTPGTPEELNPDLEAEFGQPVYPSITAAIAAVEAGEAVNPMYMDYIEDAANLGLNFWITVADYFEGERIVVRYTPVAH